MTRVRGVRSLLAVGAALSLPMAAAVAVPATVLPTAAAQPACEASSQLEAAIGVPGEAIGKKAKAGVVEVRYTCLVDRQPQSLRLAKPHAGDAFGSSVARGYFNNDDYEDVAVGIPGLDVKGHQDAGGVALFYGSKTGLKPGPVLTQASKGVPGAVSTGARFGAAVAAEGYHPDRVYVLRVGEPGKKVSGHKKAGGFVDLPYVRGKLTGARQVTLASKGIPGSPGTGDQLGAALTGSYAVGAPGRTVNKKAGAGAVLVSYLPPSSEPRPEPATLLTQASPGIPGTPEAGDHFGASLTRHWVGVPGESVGSVAGAGVVDRYYGGVWEDNPGFQPTVIAAGSHGVPGKVRAGAHFGASLAELGSYVDDTEWVAKDVLVGAPGDIAAGHARAGSVTAIGVNEPTVDDGFPFSFNGQYQLITAATPTTGAAFGTSLARLDEDLAAIGAPGDHGGRVGAYRTTGDVELPLTLRATWKQQAGTPETADRFGAAVAGLPN